MPTAVPGSNNTSHLGQQQLLLLLLKRSIATATRSGDYEGIDGGEIKRLQSLLNAGKAENKYGVTEDTSRPLPLQVAVTLVSLVHRHIASSHDTTVECRRRRGPPVRATCYEGTLHLAVWALLLARHSFDGELDQEGTAMRFASPPVSAPENALDSVTLSDAVADQLIKLAAEAWQLYSTTTDMTVQRGWPQCLSDYCQLAEALGGQVGLVARAISDQQATSRNENSEPEEITGSGSHPEAAGAVTASPAGDGERKDAIQSVAAWRADSAAKFGGNSSRSESRAQAVEAPPLTAAEASHEPPQWMFDRVAQRKRQRLSGVQSVTPAEPTPVKCQPGSSIHTSTSPREAGPPGVRTPPLPRRIQPVAVAARGLDTVSAPLLQGNDEWPEYLNKFVHTDIQNRRILQEAARKPSHRALPDSSRDSYVPKSLPRRVDPATNAQPSGGKGPKSPAPSGNPDQKAPQDPQHKSDEADFVCNLALRTFTKCIKVLSHSTNGQDLTKQAVLASQSTAELMAAAEQVLQCVGCLGVNHIRMMKNGIQADPVGAAAAAVAAHLHRTLYVRPAVAVGERPPPRGFPPPGAASNASVAARLKAIRTLLAASPSGAEQQSLPHLRARQLVRRVVLQSGGTPAVPPAPWPCTTAPQRMADAVSVALEARDSREVMTTATALAMSLLQGDPNQLSRLVKHEMPPSPWLATASQRTQRAVLLHLITCLRRTYSTLCSASNSRAHVTPSVVPVGRGGDPVTSAPEAVRQPDFSRDATEEPQSASQQKQTSEGTVQANAPTSTTSCKEEGAGGDKTTDMAGKEANINTSQQPAESEPPSATRDSPSDGGKNNSHETMDDTLLCELHCLLAVAMAALLRLRAELQGQECGRPLRVALFGRRECASAMSLAACTLRQCARAADTLAQELPAYVAATVEAGETYVAGPICLERVVVEGAQLLPLMLELTAAVNGPWTPSMLKPRLTPSPAPSSTAASAPLLAAPSHEVMQTALDSLCQTARALSAEQSLPEMPHSQGACDDDGQVRMLQLSILEQLDNLEVAAPSPQLAQEQAAAVQLANSRYNPTNAPYAAIEPSPSTTSHPAISKGKKSRRRVSGHAYIGACMEEEAAHHIYPRRPATSLAPDKAHSKEQGDEAPGGGQQGHDVIDEDSEGYSSLEDFIVCDEGETVDMYRHLLTTNYRYTVKEEPDVNEPMRPRRACLTVAQPNSPELKDAEGTFQTTCNASAGIT